MKNPCVIPSAERFRAQCTGIGQSRKASEQTGQRRSQEVIDCAPKDQRKFGNAAGYPAPIDDGYTMPGKAFRQMSTLR